MKVITKNNQSPENKSVVGDTQNLIEEIGNELEKELCILNLVKKNG